MKMVFITDLHLANTPPVNRIDNYNESIFEKVEFVTNYCAEHNIKHLLIGGDISHSYSPSDELIYRLVSLIVKADLQMYFVYGNHDLQGGNPKYIHKTNFGLLEKYDWCYNVAKESVVLADCVIAGHNYKAKKEADHIWGLPKLPVDVGKKPKLLMVHPMVVNEKTLFIDGKFKQVNVKEVETDADLLLCGHYHFGFPKVIKVRLLEKLHRIVNPGSIARISLRQAQETNGPRLAQITVKEGKVWVKLVKIPCKPIEEIFDEENYLREKKVARSRDNFIHVMQELSRTNVMKDNFVNTLTNVLEHPPKTLKKVVNKRVIKLLKEKVKTDG